MVLGSESKPTGEVMLLASAVSFVLGGRKRKDSQSLGMIHGHLV